MKFIYGIILLSAGISIVMKSEAIFSFFGRVYFFEKYLGSEGGSRFGYKLIGLAVAAIGILTMTGLIGGFMSWLVSPLVRGRF